jgi:LPXTG-motif cell wall-anchored protein
VEDELMYQSMLGGETVRKAAILGGRRPPGTAPAPAPLPNLPATTPESKTGLYVGIGLAALVVIGGGYLLFRR